MYYLITIRAKQSEINEFDFNYDVVVVAKSMEDAKSDFESNHEEYEELIDIREISVEERIERQQKEVCDRILRSCCSIRRYIENSAKWQKWFVGKEDLLYDRKEMEYLVLQVYGQIHRIKKIIDRQPGVENLTIKEYKEIIFKIMDAQTEEQFNEILNSIGKRG